MKKYVLSIFLVCLTMGDIYAQNRREPVVFILLGGASFPINNFGSINNEKSGYAGIGGGGTFEFAALVYSPGIAWITSSSYFFNPVKENDLKNSLIGEGGEGFSSGSWNNVNIMTGLKIYGPFFGPELIFTFQAGINFAGPPDITPPENITNLDFSYEKKTSFAYSLGAGFNFSGFLIGARYMSLGEPELKIKISPEGNAPPVTTPMPMTITFVYIGFNL